MIISVKSRHKSANKWHDRLALFPFIAHHHDDQSATTLSKTKSKVESLQFTTFNDR